MSVYIPGKLRLKTMNAREGIKTRGAPGGAGGSGR